MSEQENTKIVQQAYQFFKSADLQSLLGLMSEDVNWQLPEIENVPFSGKRQGREAVKQFFYTLAESQETVSFEPREFVAQNDKVVALGTYTWRLRANRREYGGEWAHVFTVRDGKIAGFHEYMDTAAAAAAFRG
ncbi:MAG TPA: nuclear transport factor 2 family protein [Pyrinomonadaceae bacterium]|nr:nuclear transport factor 2 family protein [Pyrinomonadaceae bacterium]